MGNNPLLAQYTAMRNSNAYEGHHPLPVQRKTTSSSGRDSDSANSGPFVYEQKITLHNSVKHKASKSGFLRLPGAVLSLLGDFLNEKLPLFLFTNRITFKVALQY